MDLTQIGSVLLLMVLCSDWNHGAKTGTQVTVTPATPLLGRSADVKCHVTQPPESASHDVVLAHNGDPVCAAKLHSCLDTGLLPGCGCVLEQGQTVYQFSLSNVSQADQGNWSCQVTQRCAQSSSPVQVESSPFGVQFPTLGQEEVVTLTENEVTSVQCKAFGIPRPHITWSVKGNVTEGEEGDATLGTLRLLPSRTMHGQEVTCTASNKHGVASLGKRMDVFYAPSEAPTLTNATGNVTEGEVVVLSCSVRGGIPPTSNVTLSCGDQLSNTSADDVTLVFNASREQDGVQCVCSGQHSTGAVSLSSSTALHVLYAPSAIITARFNSSAASVELVCRADGNPPSFHWAIQQRLGNTTVRSLNGTEAGNTYTVSLYDVTVEDTGTYVCLVSNSVGDSSNPLSPNSSTDVRVEGAPLRAYDTPSIFFAEVGTDAEIRVYLYSYPEIIALYSFWRRNPTEPLNNNKYQHWIGRGMVNVQFHDTNGTIQSSVSALRILNFQVSDAGTYIHHVCNRIECITQLYTVVVSGDPWPPSHLQAVSSTEQSVTLQWTAGFPGGDFSVWFQVDYRRHGNENWTSVMTPASRQEAGSHVTFTVDELQSAQIFHFRVRAHSDRPGSSNFTEAILGATFLYALGATGDGGIGKGVAIGFSACLVVVAVSLALLVCLARRHDPVMQLIARLFKTENSFVVAALAPCQTRVPRVLADEGIAAFSDFLGTDDIYSSVSSPLLSTQRCSHHGREEYAMPPPSTRNTPDPQRTLPFPPCHVRRREEYVNDDTYNYNIDEEVNAAPEHGDPAPSRSSSIDPDLNDLDSFVVVALTPGQTRVHRVLADEGIAAFRDFPGYSSRHSLSYSSLLSTQRCSHHGREEYVMAPPSTRNTPDPQPPPTPPPRHIRRLEEYGNDNSDKANIYKDVYSAPQRGDPAPTASSNIDPDPNDLAFMDDHQRENFTDIESSMENEEIYHDAYPPSSEQPVTPPLPPRTYSQRDHRQSQAPPHGEETTTENSPTRPDGPSENPTFSGEESVPPDAAAPTLSGPSSPNTATDHQSQLMPGEETPTPLPVPIQATEGGHHYSSCDPEETIPKTRFEGEKELQTVQTKRNSYVNMKKLQLEPQHSREANVLESFTINRMPPNWPPNEARDPRSNTRGTTF